MHIRIATSLDRDDIRAVHLSAFAEGERDMVATIAINLLSEETTPPTISLVAEADGAVVGHVAFSPVTAVSDETFRGYILAPLAVRPAHQKRGIGSKLIESGLQQLAGMDVDVVFVYGDPKYYSKFGFSPDAAERYTPPYRLQYPFGWQGIVLKASGSERSPTKIACVTSLCDPALW